MTTRQKRPPDRPLAMGRASDLAEMLNVYVCPHCDLDVAFRPLGDGLEVRIGHERDCPRWVAAQRETVHAPSREDGS